MRRHRGPRIQQVDVEVVKEDFCDIPADVIMLPYDTWGDCESPELAHLRELVGDRYYRLLDEELQANPLLRAHLVREPQQRGILACGVLFVVDRPEWSLRDLSYVGATHAEQSSCRTIVVPMNLNGFQISDEYRQHLESFRQGLFLRALSGLHSLRKVIVTVDSAVALDAAQGILGSAMRMEQS